LILAIEPVPFSSGVPEEDVLPLSSPFFLFLQFRTE